MKMIITCSPREHWPTQGGNAQRSTGTQVCHMSLNKVTTKSNEMGGEKQWRQTIWTQQQQTNDLQTLTHKTTSAGVTFLRECRVKAWVGWVQGQRAYRTQDPNRELHTHTHTPPSPPPIDKLLHWLIFEINTQLRARTHFLWRNRRSEAIILSFITTP